MEYNRSTCKVHGVLEYTEYKIIRKGVEIIRKYKAYSLWGTRLVRKALAMTSNVWILGSGS